MCNVNVATTQSAQCTKAKTIVTTTIALIGLAVTAVPYPLYAHVSSGRAPHRTDYVQSEAYTDHRGISMTDTLERSTHDTSREAALDELSPEFQGAAQTLPQQILSPDGRYEAMLIVNGKNKHYQIRNRSTGQTVFKTHARFKNTPSDVKGAAFSQDSQKFAAIYHYGHKGAETWIGVWWVSTGLLDSSWRYKGWQRTIPPEVWGAGSPSVQSQDLVIIYHGVNPAFPSAGQSFQYDVTFANFGNVPTGGFGVRFYLNGAPYQDVDSSTLTPGQRGYAFGHFPHGLAKGDYELAVCLDPFSQVAEANESNNCTYFGLKVR